MLICCATPPRRFASWALSSPRSGQFNIFFNSPHCVPFYVNIRIIFCSYYVQLCYDSDINNTREKKRKLENVWRIKLEIHRQLYVIAREESAALISARKTDYYQNCLEKANNKTMLQL